MEIDEANAPSHESFGLDEGQDGFVCRFRDPGQFAKIAQHRFPVRQVAAGKFPDHHGMHENAFCLQMFQELGLRVAEVIDPDCRVHENHSQISLFLRGMYSRFGMLPPARARLFAASTSASGNTSVMSPRTSCFSRFVKSDSMA